jgi:hypothetical protein
VLDILEFYENLFDVLNFRSNGTQITDTLRADPRVSTRVSSSSVTP